MAFAYRLSLARWQQVYKLSHADVTALSQTLRTDSPALCAADRVIATEADVRVLIPAEITVAYKP